MLQIIFFTSQTSHVSLFYLRISRDILVNAISPISPLIQPPDSNLCRHHHPSRCRFPHPARWQPHPQMPPSAASSARRRIPVASIDKHATWRPAHQRPPSSLSRSRAPLDLVLTIMKLHPCRSHPSPKAPMCVPSLHRLQAALASIQHLQPPPCQAGDPLIPIAPTVLSSNQPNWPPSFMHLKSGSSSPSSPYFLPIGNAL